MRFKKMKLMLFLFVTFSILAKSNAQDFGTKRIPFERQGLIIVKLELEGKLLRLAFSTASTHSMVSNEFRSMVPNIEPPSGVDVGTGIIQLERFETTGLSFGSNSTNQDTHVYLADFSKMSEAAGWKIDGILSPLDFLHSRALAIDFDKSRLYFPEKPSVPAHWKSLELEQDASKYLYLKLFEHEAPFCINTSLEEGLYLEPVLFEKLVASGAVTNVYEYSTVSFQGESVIRQGTLESIEIGGSKLTRVPIVENETNEIGLELLRRFNWCIDPQKNIVSLNPNNAFHEPFLQNRSGVVLRWRSNSLIVEKIRPLSPAFYAGIQVGDVVQRVDDIKCQGEIKYTVVKRLSDPEDSSVEFEIDREGQVLHLQLELKDRRDWK
jgi:hypothetical protein